MILDWLTKNAVTHAYLAALVSLLHIKPRSPYAGSSFSEMLAS
jgi:hypothetical protein